MPDCLLVATDGSHAARVALRHAIDFANAVHANEIACLAVREDPAAFDRGFIPVAAAAEFALAAGGTGFVVCDVPDTDSLHTLDTDAVLDRCARMVRASGVQFSPVCDVGSVSDAIARTRHLGAVLFLGRNSYDAQAEATRLGYTTSTVLRSAHGHVVVCPPVYHPIRRVVFALAGAPSDTALVARGIPWARALAVPAMAAVGETGRSQCNASRKAAANLFENARVPFNCQTYYGRPEQFYSQLDPSDLLILEPFRRWNPLQFWSESYTRRLIESVPGPVAVFGATYSN